MEGESNIQDFLCSFKENQHQKVKLGAIAIVKSSAELVLKHACEFRPEDSTGLVTAETKTLFAKTMENRWNPNVVIVDCAQAELNIIS